MLVSLVKIVFKSFCAAKLCGASKSQFKFKRPKPNTSFSGKTFDSRKKEKSGSSSREPESDKELFLDIAVGDEETEVLADSEDDCAEKSLLEDDKEANSSSLVLIGLKSTNTKSFGIPGLERGLFDGGRFCMNSFPAAEILKELFKHSRDEFEICPDGPEHEALFTRHNFLPLIGGATCILNS